MSIVEDLGMSKIMVRRAVKGLLALKPRKENLGRPAAFP
jgi:hypothetical protein